MKCWPPPVWHAKQTWPTQHIYIYIYYTMWLRCIAMRAHFHFMAIAMAATKQLTQKRVTEIPFCRNHLMTARRAHKIISPARKYCILASCCFFFSLSTSTKCGETCYYLLIVCLFAADPFLFGRHYILRDSLVLFCFLDRCLFFLSLFLLVLMIIMWIEPEMNPTNFLLYGLGVCVFNLQRLRQLANDMCWTFVRFVSTISIFFLLSDQFRNEPSIYILAKIN